MSACRMLRAVALVAMTACGGARAAPALDYADARHLLNRTGFGAMDAEITAIVGMSREAAARKLLDGMRTTATTAAPAWTGDRGSLRFPGPGASDADRKAFRETQRRNAAELRAWWVGEM